ncbi:MAG: hypothetical protein IJ232_10980 [Lachnospiraceae bacterium]|nr:hypothetical protein [Lachnospiraceae bacterium]
MRKERWKCGLALLSVVTMALSLVASVMSDALPVKASVKATVNNPRTAEDGTVTWDKIQFGSYPQDMKEMTKTPIKWRILDIDSEGNAFLLADEALDCKPYNTERTECTWETCTLRDWLNGTDGYADNESAFINAAFTSEERESIISTNVVNIDNPSYHTAGGNNTTDKVYLLSIQEASNTSYGFAATFDSNSTTRQAKATDYAKSNGAYVDKSDSTAGNCYWWLRSPGVDTNYAAFVIFDWGYYDGSYVNDDYIAVRPALHINLSSSYVKDAGTVTSDGSVTAGTNSTKNSNEYKKPSTSGDVTTWDCVYFGNYKQKAEFEKKPIEWRVLSVDGDDAFVIADKALDCKPYNPEDAECTWETCTLRDWLNGTDDYATDDSAFINVAFTDGEKNAIIETTVENPDNTQYGTAGGKNTTDKVYLLSIQEASNKLYGFAATFDSNSTTRQAKATDYVKFNGASVDKSGSNAGNCHWWLRSPGVDTNDAAYVTVAGWGYFNGIYVYTDIIAVRPALHVNLSSSYVIPAGTVSSDGTVVSAETIVGNLIVLNIKLKLIQTAFYN